VTSGVMRRTHVGSLMTSVGRRRGVLGLFAMGGEEVVMAGDAARVANDMGEVGSGQ